MDINHPVYAIMTPAGIGVICSKGKKVFQKTITWKELRKIGLKGKKITGNEILTQGIQKLDGAMKELRESQKRSTQTPGDLQARAKMAVEEAIARVRARALAETPQAPPASGFRPSAVTDCAMCGMRLDTLSPHTKEVCMEYFAAHRPPSNSP